MRLSIILSSLGLSLVFLWFGIDAFIRPLYWSSWIPLWMDGILFFPKGQWLYIIGMIEICIGLLILIPRTRTMGALLAALFLLPIIGVTFPSDIAIRDIGLLFLALALIVLVQSDARDKTYDSQTDYRVRNNKNFKRVAPLYDFMASFVFPARLIISKHKHLKFHSTILDIACGTGTQAIALAKRGHTVVGIDLSPDMLQRAKDKAKKNPDLQLRFEVQDATKLSFETDSFDAATINFALHDMPEGIAIKVLKEAKRVVKPGGCIMISEHHKSKNRIVGGIVHAVLSTFESPFYFSFREKGLESYLKLAELEVESKQLGYFGNFQIVFCKV
jgi:ubiquinone/menaquinone biosynthesis C-methylase UbiE/uncharacterized membrane protein